MSDRQRLLEESAASEDESINVGIADRQGRQVQFSKLPWGVWALEKLGLCGFKT